MSIQLLIADHHALVREGLRGAFENTEIEIAGEAVTGQQALRLSLSHNIDVLLLDIKMPDSDGFDVLRLVKSQKPDLPVLIYSQYDRPDFRSRARDLSASGYLNKRVRKHALIEAIRSVNRGASLWESEEEETTPAIPSYEAVLG